MTPSDPESDHATTATPPRRARRLMRTWGGFAACLVPAVVLAACSLGSGDDANQGAAGASSADATTTAPANTPTTAADAPTTDVTTTATTGTTATTEAAATSTVESVSERASTEPDVEATVAAPISFAGDIEPIITETCATCHTGTGPGTQHLRLDTAGIVAKASVGIEFVTRTGFMPPWPASDESIDFEHDWSLSDAEIDLLSQWHELGSPLDVPEDHAIVPTGVTARLEDPDVTIRSQGSYDGELGQDDEYRCLIYDPQFDGPGFVTGMDFVPEQEQVVHHAVGFLLDADDRAAVEALDGADGNGDGWTCFGFRPGASAQLVYAWAPGQAATRYPDGSGLQLDDGDFFVVQTHYHFDVEAPADRSSLALDWSPTAQQPGETGVGPEHAIDPVDINVYLGPAEIPCSTDESGPLCDRNAAVARAKQQYGEAGFFADGILGLCGQTPADYAGFTDGVASSTCDQRANVRGEIVSIFGHEHELGTSFRLTLHPDTPDEIVLLDIDEWDFDWQLNYEPAESIVIEPNDILRMECSWDRALRDPELEPAYIVWSDGTDDEMCFASMVTRPV